MKVKYYDDESAKVLQEVGSSFDGLSSQEAEARLKANGKNKLKEAKKPSLIARFFAQLKDPMLIILIVAAIVSGITSAYSGESMADVIIIGVVVLINACLLYTSRCV